MEGKFIMSSHPTGACQVISNPEVSHGNELPGTPLFFFYWHHPGDRLFSVPKKGLKIRQKCRGGLRGVLGEQKVSTAGKSRENCTDTGCHGRRENSSCGKRKAGQVVGMDVVQSSRRARTAGSPLASSVKRRKQRAIHLNLSHYLPDVSLSYPDAPL